MSFKWLFLYLFLAFVIVILGWYGETYTERKDNEEDTDTF